MIACANASSDEIDASSVDINVFMEDSDVFGEVIRVFTEVIGVSCEVIGVFAEDIGVSREDIGVFAEDIGVFLEDTNFVAGAVKATKIVNQIQILSACCSVDNVTEVRNTASGFIRLYVSGNDMALAENRADFRKSASDSRRPGLRSYGRDRKQGRSWTHPLSRSRRAISATFRLIDSSRRVIEESERFAAGHPIRATRLLERVSDLLVDASAQLDRAVLGLRETADRAALSPGDARDLPRSLSEATGRWIDAAAQVAALSDRLDDTFRRLADLVQGGARLDLSELIETVPALRLIRRGSLSGKGLSVDGGDDARSIPHRRRSARINVTEAATRIIRGRAPPPVSTCPL